MKKQQKKNRLIINTIVNHVQNNKKQYFIVGIIFLIGIIIGVNFINNIDDNSEKYTKDYIINFIDSLKNDYQIDKISLLKNIIINNLIIALIIWFMGSTVIGIPLVYLIVLYKGFSLGYTISSIIITLGISKGIFFSIVSMLLQNIIIIPCILALSVSGIKLYRSIMKDKRKENIKVEIIRHTVFSLFIIGLLILSSFIEVYFSCSLLSYSINFL